MARKNLTTAQEFLGIDILALEDLVVTPSLIIATLLDIILEFPSHPTVFLLQFLAFFFHIINSISE